MSLERKMKRRNDVLETCNVLTLGKEMGVVYLRSPGVTTRVEQATEKTVFTPYCICIKGQKIYRQAAYPQHNSLNVAVYDIQIYDTPTLHPADYALVQPIVKVVACCVTDTEACVLPVGTLLE